MSLPETECSAGLTGAACPVRTVKLNLICAARQAEPGGRRSEVNKGGEGRKGAALSQSGAVKPSEYHPCLLILTALLREPPLRPRTQVESIGG